MYANARAWLSNFAIGQTKVKIVCSLNMHATAHCLPISRCVINAVCKLNSFPFLCHIVVVAHLMENFFTFFFRFLDAGRTASLFRCLAHGSHKRTHSHQSPAIHFILIWNLYDTKLQFSFDRRWECQAIQWNTMLSGISTNFYIKNNFLLFVRSVRLRQCHLSRSAGYFGFVGDARIRFSASFFSLSLLLRCVFMVSLCVRACTENAAENLIYWRWSEWNDNRKWTQQKSNE